MKICIGPKPRLTFGFDHHFWPTCHQGSPNHLVLNMPPCRILGFKIKNKCKAKKKLEFCKGLAYSSPRGKLPYKDINHMQ